MPKREEGPDMAGCNKELTPEQILDAAREEGYELSEEELDGIAAGGKWSNKCCPTCGHTGTMYCPGTGVSRCGKCGSTW